MKRIFNSSGYSQAKAALYVDEQSPVNSLSLELDKQYKYVDGKKTDEITGYKAWFTQKGLPPFQVKFEQEIDLPEYMTIVNFDNLQAIEIKYNVYFKADGITEVK